MSNFLDQIRLSTLERVKAISVPTELKKNTLSFMNIFHQVDQPRIISEIKFSSPATGNIYPGQMSVAAIAKSYLSNGASALSILTEPTYFKGNINTIRIVRQMFPRLPILLKDFVLDKKQIAQALDSGANAVLLMASFLRPELMKELYDYAVDLGLTPVIEVIDQNELEQILTLNPKVIAINNRNLKTLVVDLNTSRQLMPLIPDHIHVICASGIKTSNQLSEMQALGYDGFLIGTELMSHTDPGVALNHLILGAKDAY